MASLPSSRFPARGLPSHHQGGAGSLPHLLADELRGHWGRTQQWKQTQGQNRNRGAHIPPETSLFSGGSSPPWSWVSVAFTGIPFVKERTNLSCHHLLHASLWFTTVLLQQPHLPLKHQQVQPRFSCHPGLIWEPLAMLRHMVGVTLLGF